MAFYYSPGIGTFHLKEAKPPRSGVTRVVPGNERHKWNSKPGWGQSTTCLKCGCIKTRQKPDYIETYQMPGGSVVTERPACKLALAEK